VASTRQQLVTIACLLVAIGFTYYLFLPPALLAVGAWLVLNRRRVLRHKVAVAVTVLVTAPVALLPVSLGVLLAGQAEALLRGGELRPSRDHLIALSAAVIGTIVLTKCRNHPIWRRYLAALLSCLLFGVGLVYYQAARQGGNGYYSNKALHLVLVVLLIGVGALLHHLPSPRRDPDRRRAWLRAIAPGAVAAVVIAGGFGLIRKDAPYRPIYGNTWTTMWWASQRRNNVDAAAVQTLLSAPRPTAGTVVIVWDVDPVRSYMQTLFLGTLQRDSGRVAHGLYLGPPINEPDRLGRQIRRLADPIRIVVLTPEAEAQARAVVAQYPGRRVDVVRLGS